MEVLRAPNGTLNLAMAPCFCNLFEGETPPPSSLSLQTWCWVCVPHTHTHTEAFIKKFTISKVLRCDIPKKYLIIQKLASNLLKRYFNKF